MACNVVLLTCLLFVSTFASPTVEQNAAKAYQPFSHLNDATFDLEPRIIGGKDVPPNKYPFQVALQIYKGTAAYFCGGTLYSTRFVLTAARCVSMHPDFILVGLGVQNASTTGSIDSLMNATKYVHHKDWNETTLQNDIALVQLPKEVTLTKNIQQVEVVQGNNSFGGVTGTILGWGKTEYLPLSPTLKEVNSTIMFNKDCAATNDNYQQVIKSIHMCTSGKGIVGTCNSDMGGPLLVNGVQVGIISFGPKNCTLGLPSVFTRVSEYHDWIVEHAKAGATPREGMQFVVVVAVALCLVRFFK